MLSCCRSKILTKFYFRPRIAINFNLPTRRSININPKKSNIPHENQFVKPEDTIFAKIVSKEVPAKILFEDDHCLAFHDIEPVAPVHILVIPKKPLSCIPNDYAESKLLGHCFVTARRVAEEQGLENGFRLVVNQGTHGLQSIQWLHIHIIGGKKLSWPPGV